MFKTVIFDLDGTLLDTIGDLTAAGNHICRQKGWPTYTTEEFQMLVGHGMQNLIRAVVPEAARDDAALDWALREFRAYYASHSREFTVPYPGLQDLISALKAQGVQLAVVSNKDDAFTVDLVEHFFPGQFALVRGKRPGVPVKPDPTAVVGVMEALGVETALYVGDSDVDIETAHNAALPACGVTWGLRSEDVIRSKGPEFLAHTAQELRDVILG